MTDRELMRMAQEAGIVVTGEAVWKLCQLVYEAGRKDENEECAVIAFNAKTYLEAAAAIRARREQ